MAFHSLSVMLLQGRRIDPEALLSAVGFGSGSSDLIDRLPSRFLKSDSFANQILLEAFRVKHPEFVEVELQDAVEALTEVYKKTPSYFFDDSPASTEVHKMLTERLPQRRHSIQVPSSTSRLPSTRRSSTALDIIASPAGRSETPTENVVDSPSSTKLRPPALSRSSRQSCLVQSSDEDDVIDTNGNQTIPEEVNLHWTNSTLCDKCSAEVHRPSRNSTATQTDGPCLAESMFCGAHPCQSRTASDDEESVLQVVISDDQESQEREHVKRAFREQQNVWHKVQRFARHQRPRPDYTAQLSQADSDSDISSDY